MTQDEYIRHDATALAALVRTGKVTPLELIEVAMRRLEAVNPAVNAVVYRMDEEARALADGIDRGAVFAGVPFLAKDLQSDYAGHPTSRGSRLTANRVAENDTELVRRVRATGVSVLGKTNTPEFGLLPYTEPALWGPCRNPWALDRTPGGSSGGFGGGGGRGDRADGGGRGRRRIDPHAGIVLRALRAQAHPRANALGARTGRAVARRGRRACADPLGPGQRRHAGRDPRAGAGLAVPDRTAREAIFP